MHLIRMQLSQPPGQPQRVVKGRHALAQLREAPSHPVTPHGPSRLVHGDDFDSYPCAFQPINEWTLLGEDDEHVSIVGHRRHQTRQGQLAS